MVAGLDRHRPHRAISSTTRRCRRHRVSSSATQAPWRPWAGPDASGSGPTAGGSITRPSLPTPIRHRAALAVFRAAAAGERLVTAVPGPHPVLAALLERGARIAGRDQFCATDPGLLDPLRVLPNPGFL